MSLAIYFWKIWVGGYHYHETPPTNKARKENNENNSKAMNDIMCGLLELQLVKPM